MRECLILGSIVVGFDLIQAWFPCFDHLLRAVFEMVDFDSSIAVCKSFIGQFSFMGSSVISPTDRCRGRRASSCPDDMLCHGPRWAAIDLVILVAVIGAFGFLLYPFAQVTLVWLVGMIGTAIYILKEEICEEPLIYGCLGIGIFCSVLAAWGMLMFFMDSKCANPRCRGLRKAVEFDIQLETEEFVKNSSSTEEWPGKGLFELPRDHHIHRELEAELKKMAPPNGRAVLLFRAKCGCPVGKLVVPGSKRIRKIKK